MMIKIHVLMCVLSYGDGTLVDLEIQKSPDGYSEDRCLQYWSMLYSSTIKKSKDYTTSKKTICIWIIDGEIYPKEENYALKWKVMCENGHTKMSFDKLEIHTIELKKFRESAIMKPRKKDFWLWFIDYTNEEMVKMACSKFNKIEKLQKKLDEMTSDPEVAHEVLNRQMAEWDKTTELNKARREGIAEGKLKGVIETAKKMLQLKVDVKIIAEATGLSIDEIEALSLD